MSSQEQAGRAAISFSPTRVMGALNRRRRDGRRTLTYRRALGEPLVDGVLFETFAGRTIGDSPLDISTELQRRHPGLPLYWSVAGTGVEPPPGTTGVRFGSPQWLRLLATVRTLVSNTNAPWYYRKRPGQRYLQTWHGTPLKRLVHDIESGSVTAGYLKVFQRDADAWDALISPSPYCSEIFPRAFGYGGPLLETGYPRNDRLVTTAPAERAALRARLGIGDDEQLLLYAPTWRDTQRTATGKWAAVNLLPEDLRLPDGWRLAFRGHTNTHDAHGEAVARGALDVTRYPDVTELLIAADALLTDYSSVMFDFTVTGRPVILLTPDLAEYRAARGFYFDLAAEAPGPMIERAAELPGLLAELPAVAARFAPEYAAWRERFNPWEDGRAAERVVDRFWP